MVKHLSKLILTFYNFKNFFYKTFDGLKNQSCNGKHLYIYILCLGVCLFVCLFVSEKRQNGRNDYAQNLCGTSHDPQERFI